jgi:hypothetical protein
MWTWQCGGLATVVEGSSSSIRKFFAVMEPSCVQFLEMQSITASRIDTCRKFRALEFTLFH